MKRLWILALSALLLGLPAVALEQQEDVETEMSAVAIIVQQGGRIRVTNAEGQNLEVFNLTGVRITSVRLDSEDKTVTLNLGRGCYILKVGKVVRKVTIR